VQNTKAGGGTHIPLQPNVAVVKIVASGWVDYLEEVKGQWPMEDH